MLFPEHALTPSQIGINVPESTEQEDHQQDIKRDGNEKEKEDGEAKQNETIATVEIDHCKGVTREYERDITFSKVHDIPMFPKYAR